MRLCIYWSSRLCYCRKVKFVNLLQPEITYGVNLRKTSSHVVVPQAQLLSYNFRLLFLPHDQAVSTVSRGVFHDHVLGQSIGGHAFTVSVTSTGPSPNSPPTRRSPLLQQPPTPTTMCSVGSIAALTAALADLRGPQTPLVAPVQAQPKSTSPLNSPPTRTQSPTALPPTVAHGLAPSIPTAPRPLTTSLVALPPVVSQLR